MYIVSSVAKLVATTCTPMDWEHGARFRPSKTYINIKGESYYSYNIANYVNKCIFYQKPCSFHAVFT